MRCFKLVHSLESPSHPERHVVPALRAGSAGADSSSGVAASASFISMRRGTSLAVHNVHSVPLYIGNTSDHYA